MKNQHWEAVHEVYTRLETLCGRSLHLPETLIGTGNLKATGNKPASGTGVETELTNTEDLVRIRSEIRIQLDFLRASLAEQYAERDSYLILFPIVAQIDELIQTNFLTTMQTDWPLLQKELFQIDNAGESFYNILDDILLKPQTPLFVYEVYYFCLKYGFRGRYKDHPVKIKEYLKKLQSRLTEDEQPIASETAEEMGRIRQFGSPIWNYLIAAGALVVVYLIFRVFGKYV